VSFLAGDLEGVSNKEIMELLLLLLACFAAEYPWTSSLALCR
jgi:hypothetical protein